MNKITTPIHRAARIGATIAAVLFTLVALFQLAVMLGAPLGELTQGGANKGTLPTQGRIFAGVSAALVLVMAAAMLARTERGPLRFAPRRLIAALAWITTAYAGVGVILNLITPSVVERAVWAPVTAVMFAACLVTMMKTRGRAGK
ncbi:hypothetical protein V6245_05230 [Salinibacterium amurskyense]|uniref:hypothetical protein n=1 Tax=Salinibacterium amurskyense TaxID=205941 RepID=UPI00311FD824